MNNKLYYWAENLEGYSAYNEEDYDQVIEIKRLNFFIGKNNAGKSRFLRSTFTSNIKFQDINFISIDDEITKLKKAVTDIQPRNIGFQNQYGGNCREELLRLIEELITHQKTTSPLNFKRLIDVNIPKIRTFYDIHNREKFNLILEDYHSNSQKFYDKYSFEGKFYVPILRGMRPVSEIENKQPYIERAQKDYFQDQAKYNSSNIITGESLYHELKIHLLGKPKQREIIKSYEEKLSQYFFDNEQITLIPMFGKDENGKENDVVHIKIGNEDQFPIYNLGDGLQQAIILTYEAYIKRQDSEGNEQIHAFFIEEPELHMHAGMVRQLMNFYLNETKHYYFFTTHSNHLLDMTDESDQVIIQKFVKEQNQSNPSKFDFKIYRCDRDRDLLASLGVKPSSVYLANCTIWVEGITDRLYITKYMEKYLSELKKSNEKLYKKYRRFMPNYHYTFVEYAGSNLVHWSFSDDYSDHLDDKGLSAKAVASEMLLIADGDIQSKADRVAILKKELKSENYFILKCKETENTLPKDSIIRVAKSRFSRMKKSTTQSYDIALIDQISDKNYFDHADNGIGKLLDVQIKNPKSTSSKNAFADGDGVGTIKSKLDFCREIIKDFDENPDWQLTPKATELCERIFKHIEKCNR
ncbi:ATP-dependent nuclease [Acinetobacter sp. NigerLNRRAM0016]